MTGRAIAVDLGGTNLRVALVDADGAISHRMNVPSPAAEGPAAVIDRIVATIADVAERSALDDTVPVGIAIPGPVDPVRNVVAFTPNLAGWDNFAIGAALKSRMQRPFTLGNDGNCAALGEARFGSAQGVRDLVYLALGTGVGGGVITGGVLITGLQGFASEVGHITVALDGPRCTCGSTGCLETFVAGWAITRDAKLLARSSDGAFVRNLAGNDPITPDVIAAAAVAGNVPATALLARAGRALGAAMGIFVNLFNPEMIVIGGGVSNLGEPLLQPAREAMPFHCFAGPRNVVTVRRSTLGDETGLLGAAALAMQTGTIG